jgi:m7GpppX diphosphatase
VDSRFKLTYGNADQFFENDIWTKHKVQFTSPEANETIVEMIYPATEKLIQKFSKQQYGYFNETKEKYLEVTKPYIDSLPESSIQWLYNVLEGISEPETNVLTNDNFTLRRDIKFHEDDSSTLYLLAIPFARDIKSV